MKRRLLLVLAIVVLAGCGEDEADDSAAPASGGEVEIIETDFALDPADVSVETAGAMTIRVVNNGNVPHALEVEGDGLEEATDEIAPGESAELTVELEEGEYELYCPIGNHRDQGMEGTLVVGGGAAGGGTHTGHTETDEGGGYYDR